MWNFLEFAAWLRGKGTIRMKLWNPEDVQGSAQSETRAEFSLGLAHSSSFELFFCEAAGGNNNCKEGGQSFITVPVPLVQTCLHLRQLWVGVVSPP